MFADESGHVEAVIVTEDVHVIAAVFANELGDVIGGAHCGGRAARAKSAGLHHIVLY